MATARHVVALEIAEQSYLLCLQFGSYGLAHSVNLRERCRDALSISGQRARRALLSGRLPNGRGKARYLCRVAGCKRAAGGADEDGARSALCETRAGVSHNQMQVGATVGRAPDAASGDDCGAGEQDASAHKASAQAAWKKTCG